MMKYFNEASVLYMFLALDIKGMYDIRLISRPIHAPSHELEDTDTNTPLAKVISRRIFVELLGIREELVSFLVGLRTYQHPCNLFANASREVSVRDIMGSAGSSRCCYKLSQEKGYEPR